MEKSLFRKNINQSLTTLEDLYSLGDPTLYPLIERLHYHLHEIEALKNDEICLVKKLSRAPEKKTFKNLDKLFNQEIKNQIDDFFRELPSGVHFDVVNSLERPKLEQLDQVVECLPLLRNAAKIFSFQRKVKLWLYNDCFTLSGEVPLEVNLEELRSESYKLTREMFSCGVLLTFEVFESSSSGHFNIRFKCHLKNSDNNPLIIPVGKGRVLRLSGMFQTFMKPVNELREIGPHQAYELTEEMIVEKINPEKIDLKKGHDLFHFPFLFRPLSLIIRGASDEYSNDAGKESLVKEQGQKPIVLDLDLFSLIQK